MEWQELALAGLKLVRPRVFEDDRGFFSESYNRAALALAGIETDFVQDNHSMSRNVGVLRGLHFQIPPMAQGKLIRVLKGAIWDVVVDIRTGSPTFGQHCATELSARDRQQLWIPPGFAHGFCTLWPNTEVFYKVDAFHSVEHERGLAWNDPALGIEWPVAAADVILSQKDLGWPTLADLPRYF
jgi:dTDP-4-dehydrorhamnose 3,5-epimerase